MFDDVLRSFKNKIQTKLNNLKCLTDKVYVSHTSEDEEGNEVTTYTLSGRNLAYNELSPWLPSLINETGYPAYDIIPQIIEPDSFIGKPSVPSLNLHMYYAIMSLFIQLEAAPKNGEYAVKASNYKSRSTIASTRADESNELANYYSERIDEYAKLAKDYTTESNCFLEKSIDFFLQGQECRANIDLYTSYIKSGLNSNGVELTKDEKIEYENLIATNTEKELYYNLKSDEYMLLAEHSAIKAEECVNQSVEYTTLEEERLKVSKEYSEFSVTYTELAQDFEERSGFTERTEDVNYNLINAYADGTKSFEDYNPLTEEFFKRAEYWNIRGHLYEILEKAHEGTFIKRHESLVDALCSFLDNEELKYNSAKFVTDDYNSNNENSPRPYSKAEKYWGSHSQDTRKRLNDLTGKIDNTIEVIRQDVQFFYYTLIKLVYDYLRLYEEVAQYISGETFISALQKTSTEPNKSLGDVYAKINVNGFRRYSSDLSKVYGYFTKAIKARDESKYKDDDENNIYLRKYYQYEVLKDCRFFERSEDLLKQVQALRANLDI